MNWDHLHAGESVQALARCTRPPPAGRVEVRKGNQHVLEHADGLTLVRAAKPSDLRTLDRLADPAVASLVRATPQGDTVRLQGFVFAGRVLLGEPLVIHVPPEVEERTPPGDLNAWAEREFCCEGHLFAFVGGGTVEKGFTLLGHRRSLRVVRGPNALVATRLLRRRHVQGAVMLLEGSVRLVPDRDAHVVEAARTIDASGPFFDLWASYDQAERELLAAQKERLGALPYSNCSVDDQNRLVFRLERVPGPAWEGAKVLVEVEEMPLGNVVSSAGRTLVVNWDERDNQPPDQGTIEVCQRPAKVRHKRRQFALTALRTGTCAMPDLLRVLEGSGRTVRAGSNANPLSATATATLAHPLTPAQVEAVDTALNTPDIALIQGPPGTGKTTVLRVLAQRLHELGRSPVLISSFQHDAVLRALDGAVVGGLPAIRVGQRRGEDPAESLRPLLKWAEDLQQTLAHSIAELPEDPWSARASALARRIEGWRLQPGGRSGTRSLLRSIETTEGPWLEPQTMERLRTRLRQLEDRPSDGPVPAPTRERILTLLGRQRTTQGAWEDDGAIQALRLRRACRGHLPPDLESQLAAVEGPFPEPLCVGIRAHVAPPPLAPMDEVPVWMDGLLSDIQTALERKATRAGVADALERLRHRVSRNPALLQQVLRDHAAALGATVLQAAGKDLSQLHGVFEVVIVDEAARANPLDLLVALVLGRRIVLVGDQRQLPHVLEPDLERAVDSEQRGVLRVSLFERLWQLYETAPPGGFPRVKMLDRQFRMHPVLGSFVSRTFYKDRVQNGPTVAPPPTCFGFNSPVAFFDVPGARESGRYHRQVEVQAILDRVRVLREAGETDIGIITFYAQQATRLRQAVEDLGLASEIRVGTVDAFQGREFDVVLLSCVRSGRGVGFLALENRLCVAMSRARRLLAVFGDRNTVTKVPALASFIELCQEQGSHVAP